MKQIEVADPVYDALAELASELGLSVSEVVELLVGRMDDFNRILLERGLRTKQEIKLGVTYTSIYRPGYRRGLEAEKMLRTPPRAPHPTKR